MGLINTVATCQTNCGHCPMIQAARPPLQSGPSVFDDGITHRLSMFFCHLSTFTLRQNVTQVSSWDSPVGVWPGYGIDRREFVV
jgi:hypothetical protein